jgi:Acetyl esterase (deacetylase)
LDGFTRCYNPEIGIHGIPVTMEQKVYDDVFNGALMGYWEFNMDDRDKHYYKRVIIGCIRALDYISEYTPWNNKELGVTGSSQGGFLTLATAALDKRITYYAPVHAALCDHTNSLKRRACGGLTIFIGIKVMIKRNKLKCLVTTMVLILLV